MSTLCLALPAPPLPGDRSCTPQTEGNGRLLGPNMSRYSAEHGCAPEWEFFPAVELGNSGCTRGLCSLPAVQRSHPAPAGRARLGFGSSGNAFSCTRREKGKIKRWKRGELRQCETALGDREGWVGDVGSQAWLALLFAVVPRRAGPCTSRRWGALANVPAGYWLILARSCCLGITTRNLKQAGMGLFPRGSAVGSAGSWASGAAWGFSRRCMAPTSFHLGCHWDLRWESGVYLPHGGMGQQYFFDMGWILADSPVADAFQTVFTIWMT